MNSRIRAPCSWSVTSATVSKTKPGCRVRYLAVKRRATSTNSAASRVAASRLAASRSVVVSMPEASSSPVPDSKAIPDGLDILRILHIQGVLSGVAMTLHDPSHTHDT